jgi:hypothetical protein
MIPTIEIASSIFVRGARVVCKGEDDGPYSRFDCHVAAVHENVIHLQLLGKRDADDIVAIDDVVSLQVAAEHGWFVATGRRVQNVVPGGMTVVVVSGPSRLERREYLRVRCSAPFWWRRVDKSDVETHVETLKANLSRRSNSEVDLPTLDEVNDPQIERLFRAMLKRIETLESKVSHLMKAQIDRPGDAQDQIIDISGSGMRFTSADALDINDVVEASLSLEDFGERKIKVMARVVRIDPPNLHRPMSAYACRFIVIDKRDRELVIRYTFREHRRQLRESLV